MYDLLLLPNALAHSVESVCHDCSDGDEIVGRPEATDWKVAAVLHWLVAASRRHVLRHAIGVVAPKSCNDRRSSVWYEEEGDAQ